MKKAAQTNLIPNGFTLVELAIVLMIIGLLIGGILRGQEMYNNAKVTSTIEQVKAYEGAWHSFVDIYNNYAGDMALATTKVPGCNAANQCRNGNGNSIIGTLQATQGSNHDEPQNGVDPAITSENSQFWKHLALAHLISGVDPSAGAPEFGRSLPKSKYKGGFFMRYAQANTGLINFQGHTLLMRASIDGEIGSCPGGIMFCSISPKNASQIDRKMDDGIATTGDVWSVTPGWTMGCGVPYGGVNGVNGYKESIEEDICDIMFRVN